MLHCGQVPSEELVSKVLKCMTRGKNLPPRVAYKPCSICRTILCLKTFAPGSWSLLAALLCGQDSSESHLSFLLPSVQQAPICGQQSSLPVQNELPSEAKAHGAAQ